MSKPLFRLAGPGLGLLVMVLALSCGSDKAGPGDFCEKDADCKDGLVCNDANICVKPDTDDCVPPCQPFETCVDGDCIPIDPGSDKDGDGFPNTIDCDDLDPFTHPGNPDADPPVDGGYEYCDGRDNDCDNEIDEGCRPCQEGDSQPCGTDTGECTQGTQSCSTGAWGVCSGQAPTPEEADGLDNDCDGATDEGLPCSGSETRPCGVTTGECETGLQTCTDDKWSECDGVGAAPEKCDNLDNDCDGLLDDGFMLGQTCDGIGECGTGVYECLSDFENRCSTEEGGSATEARPELCNGLDDDCDEAVDEDFEVGQACPALGMCPAGSWECDTETDRICDTHPGGSGDMSAAELCDNLDNDCDGTTDQDAGSRQDCTTNHAQPNADLQDCVGGVCLWNCAPGWLDQNGNLGTDGGDGCEYQCTPTVPPDEVCDGLDNNCNGETDEGTNEDLCSPFTAHVDLGTCNRNTGECVVANPATDCGDGWWDLNQQWADGCEVQLDGVGDTCPDASVLQDVVDHPGGLETVTGNLVPEGDEDWYRITGIDNMADDETIDQCDNYHVDIQFNPAPPAGVFMTVALDSCAATNPNCADRYSQYEYRTNFTSGAGANRLGECQCRTINTSGYNICSKEDHTFYIRVFRLAGTPVTAENYTLEIKNGP